MRKTNRNWKGKKKEHFWQFMGFDKKKKLEYAYCILCKIYTANGKKIPKKEYIDRYNKRLVASICYWK